MGRTINMSTTDAFTYIQYYTDLCPDEPNWVHLQLAKERHELESELTILRNQAAIMATALEGVLNSALHPDITIRALLVEFAPVRVALAGYRAIGVS